MKHLLILLLILTSCNAETKLEKAQREYIVKLHNHIDTIQSRFDSLYYYSEKGLRLANKIVKYTDSLQKVHSKCKKY